MSGWQTQGPPPGAAQAPAAAEHRRHAGLARRALAHVLRLLLVLAVVLLPTSAPTGSALAWTLPGRTPAPSAPAPSTPRNQEVAPPAAVQQLGAALAERQPRITILEPADGGLLPEGPWTLRLQVDDWPLVDAGRLGLGPHLLVQLDDDLPTPLVSTSVAMPALSPGSHRLTVMAARPWGEVVKRPGAFQQIRLHRVSPNALALPAPGSPQLLPVSPLGRSASEPVLLDWLLIDAPLQNLRADDARWRLRVTINGDSFLVDQQTPLWLKGWKSGSNAVLLELVDGRGEPLNPPFNSLVREVVLQPGANRPAWMGERLSDADLAQLLGQTPLETLPAAATEQPAAPTAAAVQPPAPPAAPPATAAKPEPAPPLQAPAPPAPNPESPQEIPVSKPPANAPLEGATKPPALGDSAVAPEAEAPEQIKVAAADDPDPTPVSAPEPIEAPAAPPATASPPAPLTPVASNTPPEPAAPAAETASPTGASPIPAPAGDSPSASLEAAKPEPPPPSSGAMRPAREEVNPDGTLIRPSRRNPLQVLRERLNR